MEKATEEKIKDVISDNGTETNVNEGLDSDASEQELNCLICYELYVEPVILDCEHIFCRKCTNLMAVHQYQTIPHGLANTGMECAVITCPLCRSLTPFSKHRPLRIEKDLWKQATTFARADAVRPVKLSITVPLELQTICLRIITPPSQQRRGWLYRCTKQHQLQQHIEQAFPPTVRANVHISAQLVAVERQTKQSDKQKQGKKGQATAECELNDKLLATKFAECPLVKLNRSIRVEALVLRGPKALTRVVHDQIEELFQAETAPEEVDDWCSQIFCFWLKRNRTQNQARHRATRRERRGDHTPGVLTWQAIYNL